VEIHKDIVQSFLIKKINLKTTKILLYLTNQIKTKKKKSKTTVKSKPDKKHKYHTLLSQNIHEEKKKRKKNKSTMFRFLFV
jgi:hypothetical protein